MTILIAGITRILHAGVTRGAGLRENMSSGMGRDEIEGVVRIVLFSVL